MRKKKNPAVEKIIDLCGGSQRKTAEIFGVSQTAVWQWLYKLEGMPIDRINQIERLFGNQITKEELWPRIFKNN